MSVGGASPFWIGVLLWDGTAPSPFREVGVGGDVDAPSLEIVARAASKLVVGGLDSVAMICSGGVGIDRGIVVET